jgi:GntR family transcriptional repressor for pyruvate dehydrogenase complex
MNDKLAKIMVDEIPAPAQQIAQQFLDHLLSGSVKPGDRSPSERQLAGALGVSRSTVRDALKSLGLLGVIKVRPGGGSFFQDVPSKLLPQSIEWGLFLGERHTLDLLEARALVEVVVVRLAAARRSEEDLTRLAKYVEQMKSARKDPKRYVNADFAFHKAIADASRNSALQEILSGMRNLLRCVCIRRVIEAGGDADLLYRRHKKIFEAVKSGDPEAAGRAMEEHMQSAGESLRRTLGGQNQTKG